MEIGLPSLLCSWWAAVLGYRFLIRRQDPSLRGHGASVNQRIIKIATVASVLIAFLNNGLQHGQVLRGGKGPNETREPMLRMDFDGKIIHISLKRLWQIVKNPVRLVVNRHFTSLKSLKDIREYIKMDREAHRWRFEVGDRLITPSKKWCEDFEFMHALLARGALFENLPDPETSAKTRESIRCAFAVKRQKGVHLYKDEEKRDTVKLPGLSKALPDPSLSNYDGPLEYFAEGRPGVPESITEDRVALWKSTESKKFASKAAIYFGEKPYPLSPELLDFIRYREQLSSAPDAGVMPKGGEYLKRFPLTPVSDLQPMELNADGLWLVSDEVKKQEQERSALMMCYNYLPGVCFGARSSKGNACEHDPGKHRQRKRYEPCGIWEVRQENVEADKVHPDLHSIERLELTYLYSEQFNDLRAASRQHLSTLTSGAAILPNEYYQHGIYLQMYKELRSFKQYASKVVELARGPMTMKFLDFMDEFDDKVEREYPDNVVNITKFVGGFRLRFRRPWMEFRDDPRNASAPKILQHLCICMDRNYENRDCIRNPAMKEAVFYYPSAEEARKAMTNGTDRPIIVKLSDDDDAFPGRDL